MLSRKAFFTRLTLALLFSLVCVFPGVVVDAKAEAEGLTLRSFQHTAWNQQAGAPSQILALAQTTDGYLWLGTSNGLFRFDGVTFEPFRPLDGSNLKAMSVRSLTPTSDGGLWVGTLFGDFDFVKGGRVQTEISKPKGYGSTPFAIAIDLDNRPWAATQDGPVRLVNGAWKLADEVKGLPVRSSYSIVVDRKGTLWLTTDDYIYYLRRGDKHFIKSDLKCGAGAVVIEGPNGLLWTFDDHGVFAFDGEGQAQQPLAHISISGQLNGLQFDSFGGLWILSGQKGLYRIDHPAEVLKQSKLEQRSAVETFASSRGLTSDLTNAMLSDREGNVWVATSEGLDRFRRTALDPAQIPVSSGAYAIAPEKDASLLVGTELDGLQRLRDGKSARVAVVGMKRVMAVHRAADGKLWISGMGDLGYLEGEHFHPVGMPPNPDLHDRDTQAMTTVSGDLWIQVAASGRSLWKLHAGAWQPIPVPAPTTATTLLTDHLGQVWAGYLKGRVRVFTADGRIIKIDRNQGITVGNVTALYDSGANMWLGGEHGIDVVMGGHPVPMQFAGTIKIEGISGIVRSTDGAYWLNTLPGVLRVSAKDVDRFLKEPSYRLPYRLFDSLDGLSAKAPQIRPLPSAVQGIGSTLWFTTTNGVFSIDTEKIYRNELPPPISISAVTADGSALDPILPIRLLKGTEDLEIAYSALSLSIPQRVQFRYKLEGYDKDWQEAGTRREALYSHLPPGTYTFHVIACNNDGVWNETGAMLSVTLPPTFVQSWFFKCLLAVGLIILVRIIVLIRTEQATSRMQTILAERFNERERIARDLHDTFLQGVQAVLLHVQNVKKQLPSDAPARKALEQTLRDSDAVMSQGRELLLNLRSTGTDAGELPTQLQAAAVEYAHLHSSRFRLEIIGEPAPLEPVACEELSKLGREAIGNAYRHANAREIKALLHYQPDQLVIRITDDGAGIAHQILNDGGIPNHWGLRGMKERAAAIGGLISISSNAPRGTEISVTVPARSAYRYAIPRRRWPWSARPMILPDTLHSN